MLEVTFNTTLNDLVAYTLRAQQRSPGFRRQYVIGWVVLPLVCLVASVLALVFAHWIFAVPLTAFAFFYALLYPSTHRRGAARSVRRLLQGVDTRGMFGRVTLALADETITHRTETTEIVACWEDMKGVEVVGERTYIWLNGLQAAVVPRRGFERVEDYAAVRDFALAKLAPKS